jgi:hypothetical protein
MTRCTSPRSVSGFSWISGFGSVPLAFVPNQRCLRLDDAEPRMLISGRKCQGRAKGNANDCSSNDLGSHLKFQDPTELFYFFYTLIPP